MRRAAPILLLIAFTLLGSGTVGYVHDLAHAHADELLLTHGHAHPHAHDAPADPHHPPAPIHGEWDCDLHALLNAPLTDAGAVPLLILLGLFVAFLTQIAPAPVSRHPAFRLDCRGPPAC